MPDTGYALGSGGRARTERLPLPPGSFGAFQVSGCQAYLGLQIPGQQQVGLLVDQLAGNDPGRLQIACLYVRPGLQGARGTGDPERVAAVQQFQGAAGLGQRQVSTGQVVIHRDQVAVGYQQLLQAAAGGFVVFPAQEIGDELAARLSREGRDAVGGELQRGQDVIRLFHCVPPYRLS